MVGLGQWILALSPLMRCAEVKGIEGNHYLITSTVTHTRTQAGNRPCDCTAKRRSDGGDTRTHTHVLRRATAHEKLAGRYTHKHTHTHPCLGGQPPTQKLLQAGTRTHTCSGGQPPMQQVAGSQPHTDTFSGSHTRIFRLKHTHTHLMAG